MAYGQGSLPSEVWLKIQLATAVYTTASPVDDAISVADFVSKLIKVRNAVSEVRKLLPPSSDEPIEPSVHGPARQLAIQKKYFQGLKIYVDPDCPETMFYLLEHALIAMHDVCDFIATEISNPEFPIPHPGWLWIQWIGWLTIIAKEHSLPYKARSDSDKRKNKTSAFVSFVQELQGCIPEQARHSTQSEDALAKAINRARQGMDTDCKFTDLIDLDMFPGAEQELKRLKEKDLK